MKNVFLIFFITFTFNACSYTSFFNPINANSSTKFSDLTEHLSENTCDNLNTNSTLYITDFVNESNLKNISQLGFLLSNELKVNILSDNCDKHISLKTLELAKSLSIGKQGSRIFTRNLKNLKNTNLDDNKQILVGTYIITKKQLILFTKLINLKDGNTISSSSISTLLTSEIKELDGIDSTFDSSEPIIYRNLHL
jgi:hypothetical protein